MSHYSAAVTERYDIIIEEKTIRKHASSVVIQGNAVLAAFTDSVHKFGRNGNAGGRDIENMV